MNHRIHPQPHVITTLFDDGEGVLIDVKTKRYYRVNETGLLVWQALQERQTLTQIVQQMTAAYAVNTEQATAHIEALTQTFKHRQLVTGGE